MRIRQPTEVNGLAPMHDVQNCVEIAHTKLQKGMQVLTTLNVNEAFYAWSGELQMAISLDGARQWNNMNVIIHQE